MSELADLNVDMHTTYQHHSSVTDFQSSMSAVLEDELLDKINESKKFSLMFDESTDVSVHQNLIMYIRLLEADTFGNVEPHTYFLSIDSLERANAESIYSKVLHTLDKKGIDLRGLCGVSTDGANVMVGHRSGVVTRLKKDVPGLLATHCIAHRLALSCCSGADRIPYLVKVQEVLNNVYKYFNNSPKNMSMLESVQKLVPGDSCKFKEVFHTRWLSFEGSVDAMIRNYSSLITVFLEESSGKSLSLHKPITTFKFLYVISFLADILKPLAVLSKSFQSADLDFSEVAPLLMSTIAKVEKLQSKSGPRLEQFLDNVPKEPQVDTDGLYTFEYLGHTIRDSEKQRVEAESVCTKFVDYMISSLNERFSDNEDTAVLSAFSSIFRPNVEIEEKAKDIDVVSQYLFKIGYEAGREEFEMFLEYIDTLVKSGNRSVRNAKDVANLAIKKQEVYPTVAEVAGRFLVAPVSTVDCERGFSRQNLIKTCLRNRMSVEALDKLLRLSIEGPSVDKFHYEKAVEKWAKIKNRRILQ